MAQIVNTFIGGMDKDTNPNSYSNKTYYHAENLRLIVDDDLSSATLTSIKKHQTRLFWNTSGNDVKLCGFTHAGDYGIFFLKDTATSTGYISLVLLTELVNEVNIVTTNEVIITNTSFAFSDRVEVIARQEGTGILKIYWVDGVNPIRFCNILENVDWTEVAVDKFEIVQDMEFGSISVNSITSGALKTGTHQYAYCYYNLEGAESAYSTFTNPVSLSNNPITVTRTQEHKGSVSGVSSGKGVVLAFSDLDAGFDRIRIVRAYKATQESVPEIDIVYEGAQVTTFTDTGTITLGTLIAEEVTSQPNLFIASTLETKNNLLFAGNLEDVPVNMDWLDDYDTRAFRFLISSDDGAVIKDSLSTIVTEFEGIAGAPNLAQDFNTPIINRLAYDSVGGPWDAYKYQLNSTTIGGTGINITYEFTTTPYIIDDGSNLFARSNSSKLYIDNFEKIGYNRDEIYRFGIVFYDDKGRHSFAKWIGDIRFPRLNEVPLVSTYNNATGATTVNVLGIKFRVFKNGIPANIKSFQIVRAVRDFNNSTVIDAGYLSFIMSSSGKYFTPYPSTVSTEFGAIDGITLEYINGEALFNNNNNITSSRLDIYTASRLNTKKRDYTSTGNYRNNVQVTKLTPSSTSTLVNRKENILSRKITASSNIDKIININGHSVVQACPAVSTASTGRGSKGTGLILTLPSVAFAAASGVAMYAYRRRYISPYGGTSEQALSTTTYIPCSPITSISTPYKEIDVYGGDTYISTCEIQRILWNDVGTEVNDKKYANVVLTIVESKINYNFISNPTWSSLDNGVQVASGTEIVEDGNFYHAVWEKTGTYPVASNITPEGGQAYYTQEFDLYTYNPVYSPINNTKTFISKPLDITFFTEFPSSGYRSERKFDGEQIDYWTKFLVNNRFDLPSKYGGITKFIEHNDRLISFQPKGIANIPVEERETVQTQNTAALGVGQGGIAERFDYITTKSGSNLPYSILSTMNGLYYMDGDNKKIGKIGEGFEFISDTKGMFSHLSAADISVAHTTYNPKLKEVYFEFDSERLIYNEYLQSFTSFYKDSTYAPYLFSLMSEGEINYIGLYNTFNTGATYLTPKLEVLVNPSNNKVCRYDSIGLVTHGSSVAFPLTSLQCVTQESQDTGVLAASNFKDRHRVQRCNVLRDGSNNRLVSHYMKEKFIFQPVDLKVYDVTTTFAPLNT